MLVLATYILMLASRLIDFAFINRENEYFSIVMLQMMIFLLPGALWCKFSGEKYTQKLRLKLPAPNTVPLMIAEKFGVKPEECAFIGDSDVDIHTAKNAGMFSACVTWGYRPKNALLELSADAYADTPDELEKIFIKD